MSANKKDSGGFNPVDAPLLTLRQMQETVEFFKKTFEDSPLAKWIVLAGLGALIEMLHVGWLAVRYIWKF